MGRARPELPGIRSLVFFFRYLPSNEARDVIEIVNILEGHRDIEAHFKDKSNEGNN